MSKYRRIVCVQTALVIQFVNHNSMMLVILRRPFMVGPAALYIAGLKIKQRASQTSPVWDRLQHGHYACGSPHTLERTSDPGRLNRTGYQNGHTNH